MAETQRNLKIKMGLKERSCGNESVECLAVD